MTWSERKLSNKELAPIINLIAKILKLEYPEIIEFTIFAMLTIGLHQGPALVYLEILSKYSSLVPLDQGFYPFNQNSLI